MVLHNYNKAGRKESLLSNDITLSPQFPNLEEVKQQSVFTEKQVFYLENENASINLRDIDSNSKDKRTAEWSGIYCYLATEKGITTSNINNTFFEGIKQGKQLTNTKFDQREIALSLFIFGETRGDVECRLNELLEATSKPVWLYYGEHYTIPPYKIEVIRNGEAMSDFTSTSTDGTSFIKGTINLMTVGNPLWQRTINKQIQGFDIPQKQGNLLNPDSFTELNLMPRGNYVNYYYKNKTSGVQFPKIDVKGQIKSLSIYKNGKLVSNIQLGTTANHLVVDGEKKTAGYRRTGGKWIDCIEKLQPYGFLDIDVNEVCYITYRIGGIVNEVTSYVIDTKEGLF